MNMCIAYTREVDTRMKDAVFWSMASEGNTNHVWTMYFTGWCLKWKCPHILFLEDLAVRGNGTDVWMVSLYFTRWVFNGYTSSLPCMQDLAVFSRLAYGLHLIYIKYIAILWRMASNIDTSAAQSCMKNLAIFGTNAWIYTLKKECNADTSCHKKTKITYQEVHHVL